MKFREESARGIEMEAKANMAVVGAGTQVLPYHAIGASIFITEDKEEAGAAVVELAEKGYPVILVSDDLIREMGGILEKFSSSPVPSITSIPGPFGVPSFAAEKMQSIVRKAIGLDIPGLGQR
jgi:vacuolar-type H+-ATPase subunit F/Vma7